MSDFALSSFLSSCTTHFSLPHIAPSELARFWHAGMSFFIAFPHLPTGLIFFLEGIDLKRTNQLFSESQNQEFGRLKYIFGSLFYRHVGHGHMY